MAGIWTGILLLLLLVAANGLLALSEIALVSASRPRLRRRADRGDERAGAAAELAGRPTHFLSTVQVGISLVGILAGALGGARLAGPLAGALTAAGLPDRWAEPAAMVLVVGAVTYLSVVFGELVPKRIALASPERIATRVARPMQLVARVAAPVVWLFGASTRLVLKPFGVTERTDEPPSEEELVALVSHAARSGVIETSERRIVERLFRLSDRSAGDLMTPWERVAALDLNAGPVDPALIEGEPHERYPVVRGGPDAPVAMVTTADLLVRALRGQTALDESILGDPHWVAPDFPALRLLHVFQASGVHMALVRGGGGSPLGIVTLTDLLEGVVGELPDVAELDTPIVRREDGSWLVDGTVPVRRLASELPREGSSALSELEGETVGAAVREGIGTQPHAGTRWRHRGVCFEVVDMDGQRIDKILVTLCGEAGSGRGGADPSGTTLAGERHASG